MNYKMNLAVSIKEDSWDFDRDCVESIDQRIEEYCQLLFLIIMFKFYVCFPWMYICEPSICLMAMEVRRGYQSGNVNR